MRFFTNFNGFNLSSIFATMLRLLSLFFILLPAVLAAQNYRGLSVAGRNLAWVSGSKGSILRTSNGGKTWDTLNPHGFKHKDFRDIHAAGKRKAMVMSSGDSGVLLSTQNGGKTWKIVYYDYRKGVFFDAFDIRKNQLILVGDGIDSQKMYLVKGVNLYDSGSFKPFIFRTKRDRYGVFPDSTSSYFAASGSNVQWTGKDMFCIIPIMDNKSHFYRVRGSWSQFWDEHLPFKIQNAGGAYSFCQRNNKIVAVGGSFYKPTEGDSAACYSLDGGNKWYTVKTTPGGYRSSVCTNRSGKIWICTGPNGTDISRDAGQNWTSLKKLPGYNVCQIRGNQLWLAGKASTGVNKIKLRKLKQFM
jgi:hypothetical protein